MADLDRGTLFENERLIITMLQAVSGGSIVGAVAQAKALTTLAGELPFLLFLTVTSFVLTSALLAAYWKHQYKMWDVKARSTLSRMDSARNPMNPVSVLSLKEFAEGQSRKSNWYLKAMRITILVCVIAIVFAYVQLLSAMWFLRFS